MPHQNNVYRAFSGVTGGVIHRIMPWDAACKGEHANNSSHSVSCTGLDHCTTGYHHASADLRNA
ncbi:hypothetical protein KHC33_12200 [Methanospirillum sp. J.3.6.1-F.2.7.3]|uniref:Uncharacterized protein n=1 Tax=Methanospirillum purgamenti TaxID=2834276 RepID=A0A8E7AZ29_9EURY|nr:hypothetical protein [Methanospirillum sp. J.3.6.1-F.2.7.3]MDX8550394.1 hypothetical protein [Methanospirillum hungatei]QVV88091.1 hypothetical protein KHC33_12200 [Methanospirillum sp. J.3.6.1-F.2.7.3]